MTFQLAVSNDPSGATTLRIALVKIGSQTPKAADSATVISVLFSQCRRGHRRTWPLDNGAISRNATTIEVERTGYAEPNWDRRI